MIFNFGFNQKCHCLDCTETVISLPFICRHENKLLSASSLSYLTTIGNVSRPSKLLRCHVFAAMMLAYGLGSLESDKKYFVKLVETSLLNLS